MYLMTAEIPIFRRESQEGLLVLELRVLSELELPFEFPADEKLGPAVAELQLMSVPCSNDR